MGTVWIIKEQVRRGDTGPMVMDYSPAMEYGELEFITRHDMPLYGRSSVQDVWNDDVIRFVKEYDEANDYIVATGQPSAIFAVGWALGMAGKTPRFLVWRREENRYRVVNFDGSPFIQH
jgi:hypothetical protein